METAYVHQTLCPQDVISASLSLTLSILSPAVYPAIAIVMEWKMLMISDAARKMDNVDARTL